MYKKILLLVVIGASVSAQEHIDHTALPMYYQSQNHVASPGHGMYGDYPEARDSTGTSWLPGSTRMQMIHLRHNDWRIMVHGWLMAIYDHQGGPRGGKKFMSENMFMVTAQEDIDQSTIAGRFMISFEPGTIGKNGYPLLLQTGETANGVTTLIDRQHPHDFWMELAAVYTYRFLDGSSLFAYFGLPGEPAIGPTAFINRFSALYNPEAPITHHWFDATHITFGVATAGFVHSWFKLDASIFTGREPNQYRWDFDRPRFDSYSFRITGNPTEDIAAQVSYAYLKSPEQLHPEVDTYRTTATLTYNKSWKNNNWATMIGWGHNKNVPGNKLSGYLLESTIEINRQHVIFGRVEYVAKDELFEEPDPRADQIYKVGKVDAGYIFEFPLLIPNVIWGLGFVGSFSFVPESIKSVYGGTPFSFMAFLRVGLYQH